VVIYIIAFFCVVIVIIFLAFSKMEGFMKEKFKSLSFDLMEKNSKSFMDLATTVFEKYSSKSQGEIDKRHSQITQSLQPVKDTLEKLENYNKQIEKQRAGAYSALNSQIENLMASENRLSCETANLVKALKSPNVRGGWGQMHLRRVAELSGMLNNCDFFEQASVSYEGKTFRPDMLVKLPGNRNIIVDAKTPIEAYLEAAQCLDEEKKEIKLKEHAKQLRMHMRDLSSKSYWKKFSLSPEYVILFLPAEAFFSAALNSDPTLIEVGAKENIVIATPTTLMAILRAVAFSWKQESISKSAKEIADVGKQLYNRIDVMTGHLKKLGKSINTSVDTYNRSIASLETRVLVSARRLKELGAASSDDNNVDAVEEITSRTSSLMIGEAALEEDN
jgi:DNA recombination protein RmuC